ncbi:MAG: ATP-binding cassette domain-containing protein [Ignavibacteriales bacterium]|nr:ATP-binding cassette domain-containing protein [Ignavibacteriales bacterium]
MIEVKNVSKIYTDDNGFKNILLNNISLKVPFEKITSIIAPSGSGKSTLLKIISGLEYATHGDVMKNGDHKIVYIPSQPSSFPWLNVKENISLGLLKKDSSEIKSIIRFVGLEGYDSFHPNNKSFGFRFRIALARSLAHHPAVILLDEPSNQMDIQTKKEILLLIRETQKTLKTTFLLATTNITEVLFLSDKIYLMGKSPGEIIADLMVDLPKERNELIYDSEKFIQLRSQIEKSFKKNDSQLFNLSI